MLNFSPQSDFMLPIGVFAERVLGAGISPDVKEESAQVQALLVVLAKHIIVPEDLAEADAARYKSDQLFRQIHKDPATLKQELEDVVPAEYDVTADIEQARNLVNQGQGIPHVPPFGAILAKRIPRDTVNHCLTMQAGLRVMAMAEQWDGYERIVPARLFDHDPPVLNAAQACLNQMHTHTVARVKDGLAIQEEMQGPFAQAYDFGCDIVSHARASLHEQGFYHILEDDPRFTNHVSVQTITEKAQILNATFNPDRPSSGPSLAL
jgi:hypothetical protein